MKSFLEGEYRRRRGGPRLVALAAALLLAARAPSQNSSSLRLPSPRSSLPPELDRVLRDYERAWSARDVSRPRRSLRRGRVRPAGRQASGARARGHPGRVRGPRRRSSLPARVCVRRRGRDGLDRRRLRREGRRAGRRQVHAHAPEGAGRALDDRVGHGQREPASAKAAVNPLVDDRDLDFLLYEVHDAASLLAYPALLGPREGDVRRVHRRLPPFRAREPVPGLPRAGRRAAGVSRRPRLGAPAPPHALAEARRARRRGGVAALRRRRLAAAAHGRDGRPPLRDGRPAAPSTATRGSRRARRTSSRRSAARR